MARIRLPRRMVMPVAGPLMAVAILVSTPVTLGAVGRASAVSPNPAGELDCNGLSPIQGAVKADLACADPRLAASMRRMNRDTSSVRPGTRLVVALEPPVDGHCHKVVEALLPRR